LGRKLEIGIFIDRHTVPSWEYDIVRGIRDSEHSHIALIIMPGYEIAVHEKRSMKGSFVFRIHNKIDHFVFLGRHNYSERKDIGDLVKNVPLIRLRSSQQGGPENCDPAVISEIGKYNLDLIVKVGYGGVNGDLLSIPQYGLLSCSMTDSGSEESDTTGYYEVIENYPVTVSELMIIRRGGDKRSLVTRVTESTCSYSISLNRDKLFRRASLVIPRVINGIGINGPDYLNRLEQMYGNDPGDIFVNHPAPSFIRSLLNLFKGSLILFRQLLKKLIYTDPFTWVLLFKTGTTNDFSGNSYKDFAELKPSKDRFWADPFVMSRGDKYYLFVEEFIYRRNKGHISVLELDRTGQLLKTHKIIEKPYHMSYPFIFESDNILYMIPETGGNRSIDLYKCTEFPGKWEFLKTIMKNVNAVDSTLFYHNGKWWLFTVIDKIDSELAVSPELYLFYSDDFISDNWTSHSMNPVVTDVRTARPAGKIFVQEGKIFRPSQDCSGRYGNSFDINRIFSLSETEYKEENILKVEPDWDNSLKGTHTYNYDSGFTIIDAYSFRRRLL